MDIFGQAVLDYQKGIYSSDIQTYSSLDEEDQIPIPYLFRNFKEMPALEKKALKLCKGEILDIGCGAGSHSLYLQEKGLNVTALDYSKGAIEVCKQRGIKQTLQTDILAYKTKKYDTLLLLMNGIGLAGKLNNLAAFLTHLKALVTENGQILLDSSDIIYMYDTDEDGGHWIPNDSNYYGEVEFTMEYKAKKGDSFSWLYLDYNTLQRAAFDIGFICELVSEGKHYDYLAKLSLKK